MQILGWMRQSPPPSPLPVDRPLLVGSVAGVEAASCPWLGLVAAAAAAACLVEPGCDRRDDDDDERSTFDRFRDIDRAPPTCCVAGHLPPAHPYTCPLPENQHRQLLPG